MAGRRKSTLIRGIAFSMLAASLPMAASAQQPPAQPGGTVAAPSAKIGSDDIGGVVTSRFGPEAGVWVIAETRDLGTRFAKIVVTDERGRYVDPRPAESQLPGLGARLWPGRLRRRWRPQPGKPLNLTAVVAPSLAAAAQYYPAIYWASMISVPDKSRFPGTGDKGNGIPENFKTQEQWLNFVKTNGCGNCHQIGNYATRNIPAALGEFEFVAAMPGRSGCPSGPPGTTCSTSSPRS